MKQKHTQKRSANRGRKGEFSLRNYEFSKRRQFKREELQPIRRHRGLQVRRVQAIKVEKYNGVRQTIIINIEHVEGAFDRKRKR